MKRIVYKDWDALMLSCYICKEIKDSSHFWKDKKESTWFRWKCKECRRKEYENNKEDILLSRKKYYEQNKINKLKYQSDYYSNHKNYICAQHKVYREENIEKVKRCRNDYYNNNREKILEKGSKYKSDMSDELWFNWTTFHCKARKFIKENNLNIDTCMICWKKCDTMLHHPSYESFDKWKEVVFVCGWCHQNIHKWIITSPNPINLETLVGQSNSLKD